MSTRTSNRAELAANASTPNPLALVVAEFSRLRALFRSKPAALPSPMKHEHRAEPRYQIFGHGHLTIPGRLDQEPIQILNISMRGMLFRTSQRLFLREQVLVRVQLAGAPPYEEVLEVRWVDEQSHEDGLNFRIGAALLERVHVF